MSGFKDAFKGLFNTLLGINRNPDDEFIFFWDEIEEHTTEEKEESEFQRLLANSQTQILVGISIILILTSLIVANNNNVWIRTVPLYLALVFMLVSLFSIQSNYKTPLDTINNSLERIKHLDFTDTGELLFMKNIPSSLVNLNEFRNSMAEISENLDNTTIELMNSLFIAEEKFRSIQFAVDNVSSVIDRTGLSTVNYQEIKYYSNQVSQGVDNFTSVFDESLNSNEDIVGIVKSIGRQINMLALNAGIEAARAGEMGLGFEVVSENLRRLSQHASSTTSEMKLLRSSINNNARIALETITESMHSLTNNVDSSYSSFSQINSEIYNIKQTLSALSDDMDRIQLLINTIGTEIQNIKT